MFKKREKKAKTIEVEDKEEEINANINANINENEISNAVHNNDSQSKTKISNNLLNKKRQAQFSTNDILENSKENLMSDMRYKSTYTLKDSNDATREIEIDTERDKDGITILQRKMQISKDKLEGKISEDKYMGKDSSIIYAQKSERDMSRYKVTGTFGPMRAPTNVRSTCRFDYAYGICKDFKETGYCGFGDGCVFMHDRSDYKTGWEMEEEWKKEQQNKQKLIREGKYKEDEEEDHSCGSDSDSPNDNPIPNHCPICDSDFVSPVSTKCSHYFCEKCAINHYAKSSLCFVCKKPTQGIFNNAEKILSEIEKRRNKKKGDQNKKPSHKHPTFDETHTQITNEKSDDMSYLDRDNKDINLDDDDNDEYGFKNFKSEKRQKKKNNFKTQNDWQYVSDYKSYV